MAMLYNSHLGTAENILVSPAVRMWKCSHKTSDSNVATISFIDGKAGRVHTNLNAAYIDCP